MQRLTKRGPRKILMVSNIDVASNEHTPVVQYTTHFSRDKQYTLQAILQCKDDGTLTIERPGPGVGFHPPMDFQFRGSQWSYKLCCILPSTYINSFQTFWGHNIHFEVCRMSLKWGRKSQNPIKKPFSPSEFLAKKSLRPIPI